MVAGSAQLAQHRGVDVVRPPLLDACPLAARLNQDGLPVQCGGSVNGCWMLDAADGACGLKCVRAGKLAAAEDSSGEAESARGSRA